MIQQKCKSSRKSHFLNGCIPNGFQNMDSKSIWYIGFSIVLMSCVETSFAGTVENNEALKQVSGIIDDIGGLITGPLGKACLIGGGIFGVTRAVISGNMGVAGSVIAGTVIGVLGQNWVAGVLTALI